MRWEFIEIKGMREERERERGEGRERRKRQSATSSEKMAEKKTEGIGRTCPLKGPFVGAY